MSFSGLPIGATGSVTFTSGGQTLCAITDITAASSCTTPAGLNVGTYPVTATYSGDSHYTGSTATTTYTVTKAPTVLTAGVSAPSVTYGSADTVSFSGLPIGATGSVTFTSGGQTLCTITDITAASSCTTPAGLNVGTYPVTATYSGDGNHTGSTANTTFAIVQADTAITAGVSDASIPFGSTDTLSISGLPAGAGGSVTFTSGGQTLCTIVDVTAASSCRTSATLNAATYPVAATYSGDTNYAGIDRRNFVCHHPRRHHHLYRRGIGPLRHLRQ